MTFNVGRAAKKDPTRTKTRRMAYERDLVRLFRNFRKAIIPRITDIVKREQPSTLLSRQKANLEAMDDAERAIDEELERNVKARAEDPVKKHITAAYRSGAQRAADELATYGITVPGDLTFLDLEVLRDLWKRNLNLVEGMSQAVKNDMLRIISDGIIQGQNPNDIARELSKSIRKIGINRARTIARTEVIRSYNTAIATKYKQSGVKKWRWLTALDDRTCTECARRDGKVYNWGDPEPPIHPRCRCTILAVL